MLAITGSRLRLAPPSWVENGSPDAFPAMSHSAMPTAARAFSTVPDRPKEANRSRASRLAASRSVTERLGSIAEALAVPLKRGPGRDPAPEEMKRVCWIERGRHTCPAVVEGDTERNGLDLLNDHGSEFPRPARSRNLKSGSTLAGATLASARREDAAH